MPSKTILLTRFEPFGGSDVNPSITASKKLDGKTINGYTVRVEEVPLRYKEIKEAIEGLMERYKPAAVICTGQSGKAVASLERVAINVADARIEYNCGAKPTDEPLEEDGPVAHFTRLPIKELYKRLQDVRLPSEVSNSAGTFGCNQIFYHLMHHVEESGLGIPAGFIHVPPLPEQAYEKKGPSMSAETTAKALEIVIQALIEQL